MIHVSLKTEKQMIKCNVTVCGVIGRDASYTVFSAFSAEKVDDGFEYQWVRFFCFGKERDEWLQPGVKVDARGEMNLSAHNGKVNLSCKVEELAQYVADSSNYNQ